MADEEQLKILTVQGPEAWNQWRIKQSVISPEITGADLRGTDLRDANLSDADLTGAKVDKHTSGLSSLSVEQRASLEFLGADGHPEDAPASDAPADEYEPDVGLVLQVLQTPAEILKGMTVVAALFMALLLEIELVIDQLEAMGVNGASLRALDEELRSLIG
jgi:hypothetical protein